jgi:hypothetical protein
LRGSRQQTNHNPIAGSLYSTVAANHTPPRHALIHVYQKRNDFSPFQSFNDWMAVRRKISDAIWDYVALQGTDTDMVIKNASFHPEGYGIIFCTTPIRKERIISLIIEVGLGDHIIPHDSDADLINDNRVRMTFRRPVGGPRSMVEVLDYLLRLERPRRPLHCN